MNKVSAIVIGATVSIVVISLVTFGLIFHQQGQDTIRHCIDHGKSWTYIAVPGNNGKKGVCT